MNENELQVIDERKFWVLKRKSNIKQKWIYEKHIFNRTAEKAWNGLSFKTEKSLKRKCKLGMFIFERKV